MWPGRCVAAPLWKFPHGPYARIPSAAILYDAADSEEVDGFACGRRCCGHHAILKGVHRNCDGDSDRREARRGGLDHDGLLALRSVRPRRSEGPAHVNLAQDCLLFDRTGGDARHAHHSAHQPVVRRVPRRVVRLVAVRVAVVSALHHARPTHHAEGDVVRREVHHDAAGVQHRRAEERGVLPVEQQRAPRPRPLTRRVEAEREARRLAVGRARGSRDCRALGVARHRGEDAGLEGHRCPLGVGARPFDHRRDAARAVRLAVDEELDGRRGGVRVDRARGVAFGRGEGVGALPRLDQMDLVLPSGGEGLVRPVRHVEKPLHAIPRRRRLGEAADVVLAVRRRHLEPTHRRLAVVVEERPHHRAHRVVHAVRSIGRRVGLGAPCVERLLDARVVRIVVKRLAAFVLVAHRVARAALRQVDGLVRQLCVAGIELLPRLVAEALHVDRVRE
mmetsp:Transcript_21005/g.44637  ORF Transcript_21005/g.44637 Transcript_21005/m.44637 type:complete len:448 (-) Transcript_21005:63-1406(-)